MGLNMDMEKLALIISHPIVGSTADLTGLVDLERTFIEDKSSWSAKSVEGIRVVKNYKDTNCNLIVTVLKGSNLDYALTRMLLYPKTLGLTTWMDERIEDQPLSGTGNLRALIQTSSKLVDENSTFTLMLSDYTGN
ncbi:MAG: hypothetical protein ACRC0F_03680 [Cetobacterium sp.]